MLHNRPLKDILFNEKNFHSAAEDFDQLRSLVIYFDKNNDTNRLAILTFILQHHSIFIQLIDSSDTLIHMAKLFFLKNERELILEKLISKKSVFMTLLPTLEAISVLYTYFPINVLKNTFILYSYSFEETMTIAISEKNIELLKQSKSLIYETLQEQDYNIAQCTEMNNVIKKKLSESNLDDNIKTMLQEIQQILITPPFPTLFNLCINFFMKEDKATNHLPVLPDFLKDKINIHLSNY